MLQTYEGMTTIARLPLRVQGAVTLKKTSGVHIKMPMMVALSPYHGGVTVPKADYGRIEELLYFASRVQ